MKKCTKVISSQGNEDLDVLTENRTKFNKAGAVCNFVVYTSRIWDLKVDSHEQELP